AAVVVLLVACTATMDDAAVEREDAAADALPDSLVLDLRIGTASGAGPTTFSTVADVAVDEWGRMHVLLPQDSHIRVFNADGSYLRTIGRVGFGPGEFGTPRALWFAPDGRLWV